MPLLHAYDKPSFDTFGEVIDFFQQTFEGLQLMHEHHVAHRDCNFGNIMMDAKEMFPQGFHPFFKDRNTSFTGPAKRLTRTARPPKYYLIDFGISCQFNPSDGPPLEWPVVGRDKTVPEFKTPAQYDPFPTDVYYLGNMIREQFLQGHPLLQHIKGRLGFEFMRPLVNDRVQDDPKKRPTMARLLPVSKSFERV